MPELTQAQKQRANFYFSSIATDQSILGLLRKIEGETNSKIKKTGEEKFIDLWLTPSEKISKEEIFRLSTLNYQISAIMEHYGLMLQFYNEYKSQEPRENLKIPEETLDEIMTIVTNLVIRKYAEDRGQAKEFAEETRAVEIKETEHSSLLKEILLKDPRLQMAYSINFPNRVLGIEDGLDAETLGRAIKNLGKNKDIYELTIGLILSELASPERGDPTPEEIAIITNQYEKIISTALEFYENHQASNQALEFKQRSAQSEKSKQIENSEYNWNQHLSQYSKVYIESMQGNYGAIVEFVNGDYFTKEISESERLAVLFEIFSKTANGEIKTLVKRTAGNLLERDLGELYTIFSTFEPDKNQTFVEVINEQNIDKFILNNFFPDRRYSTIENLPEEKGNNLRKQIQFWLNILKSPDQFEALGIEVGYFGVIESLELAVQKLEQITNKRKSAFPQGEDDLSAKRARIAEAMEIQKELNAVNQKASQSELGQEDIENLKRVDQGNFFVFLRDFSRNYKDKDFKQDFEKKNYKNILDIICTKTGIGFFGFASIAAFFDLEESKECVKNYQTKLQPLLTNLTTLIDSTSPEYPINIQENAFRVIYNLSSEKNLSSRYKILEFMVKQNPDLKSSPDYKKFGSSLLNDFTGLILERNFDEITKKAILTQFFPNLFEIFVSENQQQQGLTPSSAQQFSSGNIVLGSVNYSAEARDFLKSLGIKASNIPEPQIEMIDLVI